MAVRIPLLADAIDAVERPIASADAGTVSGFRYPSGVHAVRIRSTRVELIVLPFVGQQVWRLTVDGEDLTMRTMFDEPLDVPDFRQSYGAFLMHCGLAGMGHPGPSDAHPVHGELPVARYQRAWIEAGEDGAGPWLAISGEYVHRVSHTLHYAFVPRLTVRPDSRTIELRAGIENRRGTDLAYQYLCHVNWAHGPGELIQPVPMTPSGFRLYADAAPDEETRQLMHELAVDPSRSNRLSADDHVVPEYVALTRPLAGHDGWAHYLLRRPDGSAAWVGFDTAHLPYAIRWISRTPDESAAGFCLPCTSHHLGRARATEDGMLRIVPARARDEMHLRVGLLDVDEVAVHAAAIRERLARADIQPGVAVT
ncbi:MAG TPA: DUF4432 family protein [Propionicimonas sp.]